MFARIFSFACILAISYCDVSFAVVGNTDLQPNFVNAAGPGSRYMAPTTPSGVCTATSGNDATTSITNALNDVGNAGGGVVWLPAGIYCIRTHLTIPAFTALKGAFIAPPTQSLPPNIPPATRAPTEGTILLAVENAGNGSGTPFITVSGNSSALDGVTIFYPNQTVPGSGAMSWTPTNYPPAIQIPAPDASVQNVMLVNPMWGIQCTGAPGRHYIHNVYGQPLSQGISVDNSLDIGRISQVHFFQYWYGTGHENADTLISQWVQSQAFSFVFNRSDLEVVHDIFSYGYHVGALFASSANGAMFGEMTDVNFDSVGAGMVFTGTQPTGINITNATITVTATTTEARIAILSSGTSASTVRIVNGTFVGASGQVINWGESANGTISLSNSEIFWGPTPGLASIEIAGAGSRAMIQNNNFENLVGATPAVKVDTGTGKVLITGNMLNGNTVPSSSASVLSANNF